MIGGQSSLLRVLCVRKAERRAVDAAPISPSRVRSGKVVHQDDCPSVPRENSSRDVPGFSIFNKLADKLEWRFGSLSEACQCHLGKSLFLPVRNVTFSGVG